MSTLLFQSGCAFPERAQQGAQPAVLPALAENESYIKINKYINKIKKYIYLKSKRKGRVPSRASKVFVHLAARVVVPAQGAPKSPSWTVATADARCSGRRGLTCWGGKSHAWKENHAFVNVSRGVKQRSPVSLDSFLET